MAAVICGLTMLWGVGAAAVRKYAGGLPAAGGTGPAVMGSNSVFAPKEYSKVGCGIHLLAEGPAGSDCGRAEMGWVAGRREQRRGGAPGPAVSS